jgi:hypothetical protein
MNVSLLGDQNSFWLMCVFVHGLDQAILGGLMECIPPMLASLLFVLIQT